MEVLGRVDAAGAGAESWIGKRVCAIPGAGFGGYAELAVCPAACAFEMPEDIGDADAAALFFPFHLSHFTLFERGRLARGETLLVHGGTSGIGTTAIQLGRVFGARVFATAGSASKCAACERLGAERAINYKTDDFVEVIKEITGGKGVDVIVDMVGGDYLPRNLDALAIDGRLVQISFLKGSHVELNLNPLMRKRLTLTGSTLRPRTPAEKGVIARALEEKVWPHVASGEVRPVIHATFPLRDAPLAHAELERGQHVGKIVLMV